MEWKARKRKTTALPTLRGPHAVMTMRTRRQNQLAALREKIKAQIGLWETEVYETRARADAIESEAHQRIASLLQSMKAQLKAGPSTVVKASTGVEGSTSVEGGVDMAPQEMHRLLMEWLSELGEMRASAYRADSVARHAYQHQIGTLRKTMDGCMREWQKQLVALRAQEDRFWNETLYGELKVTWQKLNALGKSDLDAWGGFGEAVEIALQDAERLAHQAAKGVMCEEHLQQIIALLEHPQVHVLPAGPRGTHHH